MRALAIAAIPLLYVALLAWTVRMEGRRMCWRYRKLYTVAFERPGHGIEYHRAYGIWSEWLPANGRRIDIRPLQHQLQHGQAVEIETDCDDYEVLTNVTPTKVVDAFVQ